MQNFQSLQGRALDAIKRQGALTIGALAIAVYGANNKANRVAAKALIANLRRKGIPVIRQSLYSIEEEKK